MYRVIEGPVTVGNTFGFYGVEIPKGKFAVVEDGEYANGGYGPSLATKTVFSQRFDAHQTAACFERCDGCTGPEPGCRCAYDGEYTPPWSACSPK